MKTPWLTAVIPGGRARRTAGTCRITTNQTATMISVLTSEARRMPRRSEMLTYRHQPRYCLNAPNTGSLTSSTNSSRNGYCLTSHSWRNCMLFATRNENIRDAAKARM